MNDMDLYREYVRDRQKIYGAKRVKKEKRVRKQHFFSKKKRIQELTIQAKEMGLNRKQAEVHINLCLGEETHVYGSFVFIILQALISWLIRRILNNYFNDED
jgi:hypothetical protein